MTKATRERGLPLEEFLSSLALNPPHRIRGTGVFLASERDAVPLVLLHHLKHNQVLHETVVLLTLTTEEVPRVRKDHRVDVSTHSLGFHTVVVHYGFMEGPDVPAAMTQAAALSPTIRDEPERTTYYLGRLTIIPPSSRDAARMYRWRVKLFRLLKRNERSATLYFGIPANRVVELGTRVEL
jgi:KUP system potassium uptake protein